MELKLIQIRLSGKRAFVLFRTEPFLPVFVPFIYLALRFKNKALSTGKGHLIGIQRLYEFFENELELDLDELLLKGEFSIISSRIDQFVYWLTYTDSISGIRSREIYLGAVNEFLKWSATRYGKNLSSLIPSLSSHFKSLVRHVSPSVNVGKALSDEDLSLLMSHSKPDSLNNPFREQNRIRNLILIEILVWAGLRLGELAKLKTTDVLEFNSRYYLQVQNHEDDVTDTRADEPSLKNDQSQRLVAIHEELYNLIRHYIIHRRRPIRNGIKAKLSHGYLLTSERGLPIGKGTIRNVLLQLKNSICKMNPTINFELTPHSFRHTFADNFLSDLIEIQGLSMERAKDELRMVCGWSSNSSMPNHYAKRYISRSANSHNQDRINASYQRTEK